MRRSGIGRYLAVLSPPQHRACGLHRTRLPGQPVVGDLLGARAIAPGGSVYSPKGPYLTSATVTARSSPLTGWSPAPRQPPCGVGMCPIRPVMDSRCLSADGVRFWEHRVLRGPCASLTVGQLACRVPSRPHDQTPRGFPRSAPSRYDRGGCSLCAGAWCPHAELSRTPRLSPFPRLG